MPELKRRNFLKTLTATTLVSAGGVQAMSRLPDWIDEPEPVTSFPEGVAQWHNNSQGDLPREGIAPPADFAYPVRSNLPFAHGVASGDPLADAVIIWTRLTLVETVADTLQGQWRVASDPAMTDIVAEGAFETDSSKDFTVHVDVTGLQSWTTYYYQFFHNGAESCVGRTRTAPAPGAQTPSLRLAVCACSSYFSGYMNGYGRIADRRDIDLVVHCGDYVYDFPDGDEQVRIPSGNADAGSNVDYRRPENLDQARRRYALYRSDPDLFRAHQQHPFMIIWDNHDVDIARGELDHAQAYQAFWEWTPSRRADDADPYRRHQRFSYGQLADILFMDRHYANRYPATEQLIADQAYLGSSQNQWLRDELADSVARATQWRVIINQVFLAQFHLINPPSGIDWVLEAVFPDYQDGVVLNNAQWDGVPKERQALFRYLAEQGINDNIVLTGDMHMNWASDLTEDPNSLLDYDRATGRGSVGVEFAPSSISRGGADETIKGILGGDSNPIAGVTAKLGSDIASAALLASNANAKFMEWSEHGYGIVDINAERAVFEFWWTPILKVSRDEKLGAQLVCAHGSNHLEVVAEPSVTGRDTDVDAELAYEVEPALLHQTV